MRILFCGDIVGKSGRDVVVEHIPKLRELLKLECVIVNAENAAHGFGLTRSICSDLYHNGVDVITTGNHVWDQKEIITVIGQDKRLIRPLNYPQGTPGSGFTVFQTQRGQKILVINVMGTLFMDALDNPFHAVDSILKTYVLSGLVHAIVIDIHAEATSEKMAMGHFCDGRVSLVVGTHTHIPTADCHIMKNGTAYMTDAGMCGDYNSVVGLQKDISLFKFIKRMPPPARMQPAEGAGTLCGVYVETDDHTGLAKCIKPIRIGGILSASTL
jgi:metallophosphoesterase (TIGR00282 family)